LATKELAVASQQRTVSHFLLHQEMFLPKNATWLSYPSHVTRLTWPPETFLCFPDCRYHHFHTTLEIEVESQAVLNILTENDFQDAFNSGGRAGNGAYAGKGMRMGLAGHVA
jgi:hypothetical protein